MPSHLDDVGPDGVARDVCFADSGQGMFGWEGAGG